MLTSPGTPICYAPEVFRRAWATTSEIRHFVSPPREATRPAVFAAGTQFLDRAMGPGWLALGDALMAFDPLSASGITGALEDAIAAADTIVQLLVEPALSARRRTTVRPTRRGPTPRCSGTWPRAAQPTAGRGAGPRAGSGSDDDQPRFSQRFWGHADEAGVPTAPRIAVVRATAVDDHPSRPAAAEGDIGCVADGPVIIVRAMDSNSIGPNR